MNDVKQFILSNGDEIVCEVVEWADDVEVDMVVRRAYRIVTVDDPVKGVRFFTLRPWLLMQSGNDLFNTINSQHIIAEANPTQQLLDQYRSAIRDAEMDQEELLNERVERAAKRFKDMQDRIKQVELDFGDNPPEQLMDSNDNVIQFSRWDKDKLH